MARDIDPIKLQDWLEKRIQRYQFQYMEAVTTGKQREQEIATEVMDVLYIAREKFCEVATPAPGQGYEPSPEAWDVYNRGKAIEALDAQIAELERLRQQLQDA